jgi:hypothetical protein
MFPPKRSQVQIQRGVEYVYLRRLYQSNRWVEGVPCPTNKGVSYTNLVWWLGRDLKNRLLLLYKNNVLVLRLWLSEIYICNFMFVGQGIPSTWQFNFSLQRSTYPILKFGLNSDHKLA